MTGSPLERTTVQRVRQALAHAGYAGEVVALVETARTADDAARALGVAPGAIVKSLVFTVGEYAGAGAGGRRSPLCAGGARRRTRSTGRASRADADAVRRLTGFSIGGVPPIGFPAPIATAIDPSLGRFPTVYAAAGHPHCVFATTFEELRHLTGGIAVAEIAVAAT